MQRSLGVVVVVLDSLRADHAWKNDLMPFASQLASRGTVFTRAVAPAAWTLPSHVSMLTGLSPTEHGIQSQGGVRSTLMASRQGIGRLIARGQYLPAWLRARGVETFLGSSIGWLSQASGVGRGFETISYVPFPPRRNLLQPPSRTRTGESSIRASARRFLPLGVKHSARLAVELIGEVQRAAPIARWLISREDKGAARTIDAFADWIGDVEGPFFALINLIETHDPHVAPHGFGRRDLKSLQRALAGKSFTRRMNQHNWGYRPLPASELQRLRRAYRAEVGYADRCLERLMNHLETRGLGATTTVILTADHGESFGEHGLVGHGISLGESVANVPLMVVGPSAGTTVVRQPVGLTGLAASVALQLADDTGPFGAASLTRDEGRGRARVEVEAPGRYFHTSGLKLRTIPDHMHKPAAAFYEGRYKLITGSFWDEALYDLDEDPSESRNLVGERPLPEALERMRTEWLKRVGQ